MQNTHIFRVYKARYVLIEESEAYFYHRHAFSIRGSRNVTLRRVYANSGLKYAKGCCASDDNHPYGDEAVSLYGTSDSIIENSVSENAAGGYQMHGVTAALDGACGGRNNKVLGSVSLDDGETSAVVGSRDEGTWCDAKDNVFRDFLVDSSDGNGIFIRNASGALIENATILDGKYAAIQGKGSSYEGTTCAGAPSPGCSLTARNVLLWHNASDISGVDGFTNITKTNVQTVQPTCLIRPTGTVGADLRFRYIGGVKTTLPLWNPDGSFPCGAVVPGVNDGARACRNLHTRLNAGCQ